MCAVLSAQGQRAGPSVFARRRRRDVAIEAGSTTGSLLVHAVDENWVGRGKVKADDIAHLVDEQRIVRQLECLATVRLQGERRPHPADRGVGKASSRRHRAHRPVCRVDRCRARRLLGHGSDLIVVVRGRPGRAIAAILREAGTPLANCVFVKAEFGSHILARQAVRTSQNDATSFR